MAIAHRGNAHGVAILVLALALLTLPAPCGAVEFAGGTGEPNNPYLIATAEQFLGADFRMPRIYYRLACNIDLGRRSPLADCFRAHLDGAGFELQNAVSSMGRGVFYAVESGATIRNLTLANVGVGLAIDPRYSGSYDVVGGLAASNAGTISNCAVIGWITTARIPTVGGLVGANLGRIANCYFDGWVGASWEIEATERENLFPHVGGLAGYNSGLITNSLSRGVVVGRAGCGGLAGRNEGTINNCYSTCMVIGDVGSGGLVADNWGSLRNCYASGLVMGQLRGGLVGMAGQCTGSARNCVWGITETDCLRSGAGVGFEGDIGWTHFAYSGWSGDPNWVVVTDNAAADRHPRLVWEGAPGQVIPKDPSAVFQGGSGTKGDPYVIETTHDLENLAVRSILWDKHFVLANDLDYYGGYPQFSPIGICSGSSFSGSFDGNGHVIRNLSNDFTDSSKTTAW
ncbi:MAG: GLUG motif-containing protein, partial [Phycisphaerales bacterium]